MGIVEKLGERHNLRYSARKVMVLECHLTALCKDGSNRFRQIERKEHMLKVFKKVKLTNISKIYIPLNYLNIHWTLSIVDVVSGEISMYDGRGGKMVAKKQ